MNQLPTDYQNFIALSRYARWLPERKEERHGRKQYADTLTSWRNI